MSVHALAPRQLLVLCRGDVMIGMGSGGAVAELETPPRWRVRLDRLLVRTNLPGQPPLPTIGEADFSLYTERVGDAERELLAGDLVFVRTTSGFIVDGCDTAIYEQIDFETEARPACLPPPIEYFIGVDHGAGPDHTAVTVWEDGRLVDEK